MSKSAGNNSFVSSRVAILGTLEDRKLHWPPKTALSGRAMKDAVDYSGMDSEITPSVSQG